MPKKPPIEITANGCLPSGLTRRSSILPMVSPASLTTLLPTTLVERLVTATLASSTVCGVTCAPARPERRPTQTIAALARSVPRFMIVFLSWLTLSIAPLLELQRWTVANWRLPSPKKAGHNHRRPQRRQAELASSRGLPSRRNSSQPRSPDQGPKTTCRKTTLRAELRRAPQDKRLRLNSRNPLGAVQPHIPFQPPLVESDYRNTGEPLQRTCRAF